MGRGRRVDKRSRGYLGPLGAIGASGPKGLLCLELWVVFISTPCIALQVSQILRHQHYNFASTYIVLDTDGKLPSERLKEPPRLLSALHNGSGQSHAWEGLKTRLASRWRRRLRIFGSCFWQAEVVQK